MDNSAMEIFIRQLFDHTEEFGNLTLRIIREKYEKEINAELTCEQKNLLKETVDVVFLEKTEDTKKQASKKESGAMTSNKRKQKQIESSEEDDKDDGPPPPKKLPMKNTEDTKKQASKKESGAMTSNKRKQKQIESSEEDDKDDGPPPPKKLPMNNNKQEEKSKLKHYEKIARACGVMPVGTRYKTIFSSCSSEAERIEKVKQILRDAGMKGRISMEGAEKLKLQREAAELGLGNIISSEGRSRRNVFSFHPTIEHDNPVQKKHSAGRIVDSDSD